MFTTITYLTHACGVVSLSTKWDDMYVLVVQLHKPQVSEVLHCNYTVIMLYILCKCFKCTMYNVKGQGKADF